MGELRPVILIVEDNNDLVQMYKERFEQEKFIVEIEKSGDKALRKITLEKPDIVLLDLMIPGRDGIEVLQIIKSNPIFKEIPVIVFTAYPKEELKRLASNAGAAYFLSKSETLPGEIIEKVKNTIGWNKK